MYLIDDVEWSEERNNGADDIKQDEPANSTADQHLRLFRDGLGLNDRCSCYFGGEASYQSPQN